MVIIIAIMLVRLIKIIWAIFVLLWLIVEILYLGFFYILYVIWNFRFPKNFWHKYHCRISDWDGELIEDNNILKTFVRRYKSLS